MKKPSAAIAFAHRLRRYLGGLLVLGFGVTWWELSPPAPIADPMPAAPEIRAPGIAWGERVVAHERVVAASMMAMPRRIVHRPRRVIPLPVVIEKPPVEPVIQPVSLLPPVAELPPIELPVIEAPPKVLPPIITRGSR